MAKVTKDGNNKALADLICSEDIAGGIHHQLIFLSILNSFLSITAFVGNTLILIVLHKVSSLHPPSKLLFRTLATTDLCVGVILEPLNVATFVLMVSERWDICRYVNSAAFIAAYILSCVSLLTITAISVDRLLALLLGIRYRHVVTLKRTFLMVVFFGVVSIIGTATYFWNYHFTLWFGYIGISTCLVTSAYCYAKFLLVLRQHKTQVQNQFHQEQPSQRTPLNMARFKKTVTSALWVQLTLVVCYLPYNVVDASISHSLALTPSVFVVWTVVATLVFLNSSLNPILYCWKIREVKQAVKDTIRQLRR